MSIRQDQADDLIGALERIGAALALLGLLQHYGKEVDPVTRADLYKDIDILSARLGDHFKAVVDPKGAGSGH